MREVAGCCVRGWGWGAGVEGVEDGRVGGLGSDRWGPGRSGRGGGGDVGLALSLCGEWKGVVRRESANDCIPREGVDTTMHFVTVS